MNAKPSQKLLTPIQFVSGVGPHRAELFRKLGVSTVADLLFFFPRRYEDYSQLQRIDQLQADQKVSVCGEIVDVEQSGANTTRHRTCVLLRQTDTGTTPPTHQYLRAIWFNQPFLLKKFGQGQRVVLVGKPRWNATRWEMVHPKFSFLGTDESPHRGEILPVYQLTERLNQHRIRQVMEGVLEEYCPLLEETFPESFLKKHALPDIQTTVRNIHRPADHESLAVARQRLVYQELFVLQTALAMRRFRVRDRGLAREIPLDGQLRARILNRFPFEFSESQLQAVDEIAADLNRRTPMNRLLQGDVGSGKTAVALFAMLLTVARNHQAILMAPTEILARQHFRTLQKYLSGSRVHIELWAGGVTEKQRQTLRPQLADGTLQILVGTQALAQAQLDYHSLGLVIVDEQHKFGVKQRGALKQHGIDPHYLVMTATPIPRTVTMTLFGDLDVSTIQRRPNSQPPPKSYLGTLDSRERWWEFFREQLRKGRQGYVVVPLVDSNPEPAEDSPDGDGDVDATREATPKTVAGAEQTYESLVNGPLSEFRVDLLHGRQSADEKDAALLAFSRGHTQVLVATSVVEVGIDVPNATVMSIESADRFGLSQLHQLRGRVGRGQHQGYVCCFTHSENPSTLERLQTFVDSNDGFELAEQDLILRGPGNMLGTQQHGMPPLRIANILRDGKLLEQARGDARRLIDNDPLLKDPQFARLKKMILARYGESLELSDVG